MTDNKQKISKNNKIMAETRIPTAMRREEKNKWDAGGGRDFW